MHSPRRTPAARRRTLPIRLSFETLEDRQVPSTFHVLNLNDSGAGSLRQAMLEANALSGADSIHFQVTGSILLTTGALPPVTELLSLDGATAPGFAGTPSVEIDYNGFAGMRFAVGANGSRLLALGHVRAGGAGITLEARDLTILGNYIGLRLNGSTLGGNLGNGLEVQSASFGNQIGGAGANEANVISGNGGAGIALLGSDRNRIVGNIIGLAANGDDIRSNGGDGILLTNRADNNTIGGVIQKQGNILKPPEGNVISGNGGNGMLIEGKSRFNSLSGNFIGVDLGGLLDRGNGGDGVAIVGESDDNALIGTFRNLPPFVFFNVLGGNGGNGLRVKDSDRTIIHANYFGQGADDKNTNVGNTLDGVLIEGNSSDTQFGGVIPLGNVTAYNGLHGVEVKDKAKNFLSDNTFSGVGSFKPDARPNGVDGFHITSTGSGILLRTNVISGNLDDGVEVSGSARGVQIVQSLIGLNTDGSAIIGNGDNGVEIGGNARDIVIGGVQTTFSVAPQNAISGNGRHGVAVFGAARGTKINFSHIGTNMMGNAALGNGGAGVYLGVGTRETSIGSKVPNMLTIVSGNLGGGIVINSTRDNTIFATLIGVAKALPLPLPNAGHGIHIMNSSGNTIGGKMPADGNTIAFNTGDGVRVASGNSNAIRRNSIYGNQQQGIALEAFANRGQPAPILTSAISGPGQVRVAGTLTAKKKTTYTFYIYGNFNDDPVSPQGHFFLGYVQVKTNSQGVANFSFIAYSPPPGAQLYTATATDPDGNTSIFSNAVVAAL